MLKNIELFDKLSLRFNGRVLFIKDVIGDEICCWSFYGQGRKIAEVCCTSIVYATEKKQTKVRHMIQINLLIQSSIFCVFKTWNLFISGLKRFNSQKVTELNVACTAKYQYISYIVFQCISKHPWIYTWSKHLATGWLYDEINTYYLNSQVNDLDLWNVQQQWYCKITEEEQVCVQIKKSIE